VTRLQVADRVMFVATCADAGDYEAAHAEERRLHRDVLREVAAGAEDGRWLAEAALTTLDLEFPRYCA
jgi:hypothetical protein